MKKATTEELILAIDWNKEWDDLNNDEKANFLSLRNFQFLSKDNERTVKIQYNLARLIVEERGVEKLYLYL